MRNNFYLPNTYSGFNVWLQQFAIKFEYQAPNFGYGAAEINSVKRDALAFDKAQQAVESFSIYKKQIVKWRNILLDGKSVPELSAPHQPQSLNLPADFAKGIKPRIRKLVRHIKTHPNYSASVGKDLGIIGSQKQQKLSELKPIITLVFKGGVVVVQWKKGIADAIHIEVMRSPGKWELAGIDMEPHFIDSTPITQPAIWKYRAAYLINDERVGQWSAEASIAVG